MSEPTSPPAPEPAPPRLSLAVVPAAGRGDRFGGAKLLADVGGQPLLNRTIASLLDGGVEVVVVVLPPAPASAFDPVALLSDERVRVVINPDPDRGMFSSIQTGLDAGDGDPILVLPGDMPFVKAETVAAVLEAARESGAIVSPSFEGRRGHPVAAPGSLRRAILDSDAGADLARLLKAQAAARRELAVSDPGVVRDVDERADLTRD